MAEIQVTMSKLRQNLGSIVNQAAYGGERIILMAHGQPKAAIIGIEDLQQLQQLNHVLGQQQEHQGAALAATAQLRERIREWQETYQIKPESSLETLDRLRTEHDDDLSHLP